MELLGWSDTWIKGGEFICSSSGSWDDNNVVARAKPEAISSLQKLTKFAVEPLERRRIWRLVEGMCELLDREILEVSSDDLLGEGVIQDIVVDRHPEITRVCKPACVLIFGLEDLAQRIGEHIQRGEWHAQGVFVFEDAHVHTAGFAQGIG